MDDFEKSSDSTEFGSRHLNQSEKKEEKKKKKKRSSDNLMFISPGPLQAEIDRRRRSKPPNFLLPEHTSKTSYRCVFVSTIFRGATEAEFRATFLPTGEADRSGGEEDDHFPNSENIIEVEKEIELDKDKCPTCRGRIDYDVEVLFTGKCAICFTENTQCSLVCSLGCDSHGLCDMCFKHYEQ